jgi:LysR family transcriptional regulator for bpeEF and oprC
MNETIQDLAELRVFAAVASRRSFVGAATALGIPKATVSRKVQALESRLGTRLLQRSTRRVSLTEAGAAFLERCADVEAAVAAAEDVVARLGAIPRGTLRVTAPHGLAQALVTPTIPEFLARYPEIRLWLTVKNETEDLVGKGADLVITPLPVADASHVVRTLGSVGVGLYASPSYLARRGRPRAPAELSEHATLVHRGTGVARHEWTLRRAERVVQVPLTPVLVVNDIGPLRVAARGGCGVALLDHVTTAADVASRRLVPVLREWSGPPVTLRALYASRVALPPKVRVFLEVLAARAGKIRAYAAEASPRAPAQGG